MSSNTINVALRRSQSGPMNRYCNSILEWPAPGLIIKRNTKQRDLDHYVSFTEYYRRFKKGDITPETKSVPIIVTVHHFLKKRRVKKYEEALKLVDHVCVVSNEWKKCILDNFDFSENQVTVIYNGVVDRPSFLREKRPPRPMFPLSPQIKSEIRAELGIHEDAFVIGHLGREHEERKRTPLFKEALDIADIDCFTLFIEEAVRQPGLSNMRDVGFWKFNEIYNIMDLYVVSASLEGGPLGFIEATACGVPVVSTKVGMCLDFQDSDMLCEVDDVEGLADRIKYAKQNYYPQVKEKAMELRRKLSWLNWQWTGEQYHKLYRKVLSR